MKFYRGNLLTPTNDNKSFDLQPDMILKLGKNKVIKLLCPASELSKHTKDFTNNIGIQLMTDSNDLIDTVNNKLIIPSQDIIMPSMVNTHDHAFQPPGIPGELIFSMMNQKN